MRWWSRVFGDTPVTATEAEHGSAPMMAMWTHRGFTPWLVHAAGSDVVIQIRERT